MKRILRWMLTGIVLVAGSANGQTVPIPGKPIRLIVQFPPGGGMDVTGRHLSERLSAALGVPVVIENKPGAGGLIGARELIRATPDGHTLGYFVIDSLSALPHLYAKPPYDPILDFTPIAQVARTGFFLSAHPSVVATNLKELIAFAKENPGKLSYGSWALGSSGHLLLEQLKIQHALDIVHVPYNGIVNAQRDLLEGRIHLVLDATATGIGFAKANKTKIIGVTGASRYPGLDDIATFGEQGLPGFEIGGGSALFGPAQLGQPIVERVHAEIVRIIARHDTVQFFHTMGWTPTGSAPNTLRENLTSTSNVWGPLIRRLGIKAD